MKHLTILKFRYAGEQTVHTRKYQHGVDAERWLENKVCSLKLYNPTHTLDYAVFSKEVTS